MMPLSRSVENTEEELVTLRILVREKAAEEEEAADKIAVCNTKLRLEY